LGRLRIETIFGQIAFLNSKSGHIAKRIHNFGHVARFEGKNFLHPQQNHKEKMFFAISISIAKTLNMKIEILENIQKFPVKKNSFPYFRYILEKTLLVDYECEIGDFPEIFDKL